MSSDSETVIDVYTSEQAEEDGLLVDLTKINPKWGRGLFNYVTSNLLSKGYMQDDKISIPCVIDLLNQAINIVKTRSKDFKEYDTFFSGTVELPTGAKQLIFIEKNETEKFTIMLPEDR
jgi:hypothetical protein